MGTLYVVGTPIGNLEDLTLRAARVLGEVSLIAAEDTRVTRKLLSYLDVHVPVTSCHQHNWQSKLSAILEALGSGDVALVTDAGMPGISDPGCGVVSEVARQGFRVEAVPGASAVTTALAVSGLPADTFLFLGFLPRRNKERRALLESAIALPHTLVFFESPHRLAATLGMLLETLSDREIAVCRELTKLHEEVFRGTISQAIQHFDAPRGEFVLVVQGVTGSDARSEKESPDLASIEEELASLRASGVKAREAVALVAETNGLPKKMVYQLWLQSARR